MTCSVTIRSIAGLIVDWEPFGEIAGFAEGDSVVQIDPDDDNDTELEVSSDGRFGQLTGNNKTNGELTIMLHQASPYAAALRQLYYRNRFASGRMTIVNTNTGETHVMNCVTLKNLPATNIGTEGNGGDEFMFTYLSKDETPPLAQLEFIGQSAVVGALS